MPPSPHSSRQHYASSRARSAPAGWSVVSARLRFAEQSRAAVFALGASTLLMFGSSMQAATEAWDTSPGSNLFSGTNWTPGTTPGTGTSTISSGDSLYFGSSSVTTLNDDEAAGFTFAGINFNSDASAYSISGNAFTLTGGIVDNGAATQTISDDITLNGDQTFSNTATAQGGTGGTLTLSGMITGTGVTLTTNASTNSGVAYQTVFTGTVNLASLVAQGNANNGPNYASNPTTTFNNATLTTTGNVVIGRSNLTFAGTTVATIAGTLGSVGAASPDWANLTIQGSANVTVASVNMTGSPVTGQFRFNGGTLTTGSIAAIDSTDSTYYVHNVLNGTQIIASQSNAAFLTINQSQYFAGSSEVFVGNGGVLFNSNGNNIGTAVAFNNDTGATGFLTKSGTGTLTLSGDSTYTGGTTISAGRLVTANNGGALGTGGVFIGSGATLELNATSNQNFRGTNTITGAGTIQKTGGAIEAFGGNGGNVTVSLGAGALIDVQAGTLQGSSSNQGSLASNQASLNIASGAMFDGREGTIKADALTGAGTLQTGYYNTGTATIGVANGSGTFSGVIRNGTIEGNNKQGTSNDVLALTKVGSGVQTLTGANTYTGATNVNGGALLVNGNSGAATGAVTVSGAGTTLGGTGTVGGTVSVGAGSIISAGAGQTNGKFAIGALTLASTSVFNALVTSGGTAGTNYSQLVPSSVSGMSGATFSITTTNGATFTGGEVLTLISSSSFGTAAAQEFSNASYTAGGYTFTANYTTNAGSFDVNVMAVPEPATWVAGVLVLGAFSCHLRRRQRSFSRKTLSVA